MSAPDPKRSFGSRQSGFKQKLKVVGGHVETDGGLGANSPPLWWRASFASLTPVFALLPVIHRAEKEMQIFHIKSQSNYLTS
jgi:hypothetical protein